MSTQAHKNARHAKNGDGISTETANNPFDTVFDDKESDIEWWDKEENSLANSNLPDTEARIMQWPKAESASARNAPIKQSRTVARKTDKRYSVHKPTRDKSKGRQRKQNALAGIKVITNFSKSSATIKASPTKTLRPAEIQQSKTMPQIGSFVDLAALQALNGEAPQPSGGFWKTKKNKDLTRASASKHSLAGEISQDLVTEGLAGHSPKRLKPIAHVPSPLDLSPSDRPIVIGISISSARLAEHTLSPETATSATSNIFQSYEHRTPTNMAPETPTIIITPAQAGTIWSALEDNSAGPTVRPASSIYSQAPHNVMGIYTQNNAPPVPQMPASVIENERQRIAAQKSYFSPDSDEGTSWEDDFTDRDNKSRSRAFSTGTIFEEDESPVLARKDHSVTVSARVKDLKHASISTVATRRRSRGWWNYITTPFLSRSNTVAARGVFEDQPPPALPSLATAAEKAQEAERDGKMWEKQFSPATPATTTTMSSDAWWDTSAREDLSKHEIPADKSPEVCDSRHKVQTSTGTLPFFSSEIALVGGSTPSLSAEDTDSQPDRGASLRSLINTHETPMPPGRLNSIPPRTHNPFVQPRLTDLENPSSTVQRTRQQSSQSARPALSRIQAVVVPSPPPPYSPANAQIPRYGAVLPPNHTTNLQYPVSPGPLSPGLQQAMSTSGGIPMSEVLSTPANRRPIILNSEYSELTPRQAPMVFDAPPLQPISSRAQEKAEAKRQRHEKEDAIARKAGGLWRGRDAFQIVDAMDVVG